MGHTTRRSRACSCCWLFVRWLLLANFSNVFGIWSVWDWAWEPRTTCQNPALPANQSGLKVLVYGPAKTGTKSMSKALLKVGFEQTYHSEEVLFNVWTGVADEFWRRAENGGAWPHATVRPPARKGGPLDQTDSDLKVLRSLRPEELAAAISRCRVDAMAFDGIEELFWPTLAVSPGAKVVSLNWRTWQQYQKSANTFAVDLGLALYFFSLLTSPVHLLPWSVVLLPVLELLFDDSIHKFLSSGGPPFTSVGSFPVQYFRYNAVNRRWLTHTNSGLTHAPADEAEFYAGFEAVRKAVPAEDFFEWDMKRHTMADLCGFLGIQDALACKEPGPLPKGINVLYIEREQWHIVLSLVPLYLVLHWANWKVVGMAWFVLSWPIRKLRRSRPKID